MKKIIWVGMNKNGGTYVFTGAKPIAKNGELHGNWYGGAWYSELFDLELKPLEIVEIIIDTETQSYEIKREREIGWYLGTHVKKSIAVAYHWNGLNFNESRTNQRTTDGWGEDEIIVLYKLPYNEYLKGLE